MDWQGGGMLGYLDIMSWAGGRLPDLDAYESMADSVSS